MYSKKDKAQSIHNFLSATESLKLQPIYFFFGEDSFSINSAIKIVEQKVQPFITSDFDKEIINVEKKENISALIDLCYTFPFGSEKKLIIVKNFENFSNKKLLVEYIKQTNDATILVIANYSQISSLSSEPFKSLLDKKWIYEAKELKGLDLEKWVKNRCKEIKLLINDENIKTLIEIVGEDKSLIDMQLQKFRSLLKDGSQIDEKVIIDLTSKTKEYSIFDLMNALGKGHKKNAINIINNILESGKEMTFILSMLTKYFSVIAQSIELHQRKISDEDASKAIGTSKYFYYNCKNATFFKDEQKLLNAINVLYDIEIKLKTSVTDQKTLAFMMISEIFK